MEIVNLDFTDHPDREHRSCPSAWRMKRPTDRAVFVAVAADQAATAGGLWERLSLDQFALAEMQRRIADSYARTYPDQLRLSSMRTAPSRNSPLIQLADLIAGAVNRRLNHKGDRNFKDDMADMIVGKLGLALNEEELPDLDAAALFLL